MTDWFSGFSVGFCMNKKLSIANLSSENNLLTFQQEHSIEMSASYFLSSSW